LWVSLPIRSAASTVRRHDDEIAPAGFRGVDDRPVGMFMLGMDGHAPHAGRLRYPRGGAEDLLGLRLHPHLVRGRGVLDHLRVGGQYVKRRQHGQRGNPAVESLGQCDAMGCSLAGKLRSIRGYQDVRIHQSPPWSAAAAWHALRRRRRAPSS
jgi:hypothetical protein